MSENDKLKEEAVKEEAVEEELFFDDTEALLVVDGDNDVFEDTPFRGKKFAFYCEPDEGDVTEATLRRHTKIKRGNREITDAYKITEESFIRQVKRWEGINFKKDAKGDPISRPCDLVNKKWLVKKKYAVAQMVNIACRNSQIEQKEVKKGEIKNSLTSGSIA
ncbi:MAG TPA: hypothetical protein VMV77_15100 [Bacteroidales bacterium]|nr:hypothetical protein [Bacteroidales bacterium]